MGEHWRYQVYRVRDIEAGGHPWTLGYRETCRDEHPVESLYLSHERGPAINSVVNRFHALLPFTEALSSQDYVSCSSSASSRKQTRYCVPWFDVCISAVVYLHTRLSSEGNENFRATPIATLGQLAFHKRVLVTLKSGTIVALQYSSRIYIYIFIYLNTFRDGKKKNLWGRRELQHALKYKRRREKKRQSQSVVTLLQEGSWPSW